MTNMNNEHAPFPVYELLLMKHGYINNMSNTESGHTKEKWLGVAMHPGKDVMQQKQQMEASGRKRKGGAESLLLM